jgi:hypothetical protein
MKTFEQVIGAFKSTTDNHLQLWYYNDVDRHYYPIKPTSTVCNIEDDQWHIGIKNSTPFDGAEYLEDENLYLKYFNYPLDNTESTDEEEAIGDSNPFSWVKHMLCCIPDHLFLDAVYEALKLKGMAIKMAEKLKENELMEIHDYDVIEYIQNNELDIHWRDLKGVIEHNNYEERCAKEYMDECMVENYLESNNVSLSFDVVKDIISHNGYEDEIVEEYCGDIEEVIDNKCDAEKRRIICSLINNL